MTDDNQTLRDDIAFMRQLAQAGGEGPMRGGAILTMCGLVFGSASLVTWWAVNHDMGGRIFPIVWIGSMVLFLALFIPLKNRTPRHGSTRQIATGMAWSCIGFASSAIWISLVLMAWRSHHPEVMAALAPVYLSLYGGVWFMSALLWRKPWLWVTAYASCAAALASAWFSQDGAIFWLVYGVSLLAVLTAPGLYMMRLARQAA